MDKSSNNISKYSVGLFLTLWKYYHFLKVNFENNNKLCSDFSYHLVFIHYNSASQTNYGFFKKKKEIFFFKFPIHDGLILS